MTISKEDRICKNCEWYSESRSETHGFCKCHPPVFTRNDDRGHPRFYNPVVAPHNFCSFWEEIEQ